MWFRGVVASMGLCLDLGAILEGHPDVVLAVNGDVIHHRQPVCFPELRQRLPAPQFLQIGFDLVLSCHALGNQVGDLGVSGIGFSLPRFHRKRECPAGRGGRAPFRTVLRGRFQNNS